MITKLNVFLTFDQQRLSVGQLVQDGPKIYFRYDPAFMEKAWSISPFKLPLKQEIFEAPQTPFDGLHGVFADSLPDGWGKLLIDRSLQQRGVPLSQITMLQRLSFVGAGGMGALVYEPETDDETNLALFKTLDEINDEIELIQRGETGAYLEELLRMQGSSGGARPKINVGINPVNQGLSFQEELPEGFEHWMIKFSNTTDFPDAAQLEYAYSRMALACGIEMMPCMLIESPSGKAFFATKRFDRIGDQRLHLHSLAGILHDDFRLSQLDYGHLFWAAFELERDVAVYEKVFRLAAFNVLACNRDDHSKNFSFLMDHKGQWRFSPAYDLTFSLTSHGFQSMAVNGESQNPGVSHLLKLAEVFDLKEAARIIQEVQETLSEWKKYASDCGVSQLSTKAVWNEISARIHQK